MSAAYSAALAFTIWKKLQLDSTLGPQQIQAPPAKASWGSSNAVTTYWATMAANLASQQFQAPQQQQQRMQQSRAAQKEKGRVYSSRDVANIMGWCGITDAKDIIRIWGMFQTSKQGEDHLWDLMKGMQTWAEKTGLKISKGVYFIEQQMKDIVNLKPAPGDCVVL